LPRVSQFFGIIVAMYHNDHAPPHFHAAYGEFEAQIGIESLAILRGGLPRRALALVLEWGSIHREELRRDWDLARQGRPLRPIAPLD
jgi:hypothetical protein